MSTRRQITLDALKGMTRSDALYMPSTFSRSGFERWRVNGAVQTWKRDAGRVRVPVKFGLYNYSSITETEIDRLQRIGAFIDSASYQPTSADFQKEI
jgi:hypothetical protein